MFCSCFVLTCLYFLEKKESILIYYAICSYINCVPTVCPLSVQSLFIVCPSCLFSPGAVEWQEKPPPNTPMANPETRLTRSLPCSVVQAAGEPNMYVDRKQCKGAMQSTVELHILVLCPPFPYLGKSFHRVFNLHVFGLLVSLLLSRSCLL